MPDLDVSKTHLWRPIFCPAIRATVVVRGKIGVLMAVVVGNPGGLGGFRGWSYRVSPSGEFEHYAMRLRSPAGIGIGPEGDIFT